jgi:hypothetical protein
MFAVIAAVLIFLAAVGVGADAVDLFRLGIAFLALHFAWDFRPWHR